MPKFSYDFHLTPYYFQNIDRHNNRLFTQTYGNHIVDKYCFTMYI